MCGGVIDKIIPGGQAQPVNSTEPVIGTPQTVTTQIGDTGAASVAKRKPQSLLSRAGSSGDLGNALVGQQTAKATLGA